MEPSCNEKSRSLTPEEEEEELKRNTDCVYFLASPLTCKKGKECEYRHSEGARLNSRDCWYWVNGNCLNPKCSFRHLPLDVLFGTPGTTSVAALPSQTVSTPQIPGVHAPASNTLNKQNVPCYYFQKGQCLKGDRCPFMHGPEATGPLPTGTPIQQQVGKVSASITVPTRMVKKELRNLECITQQNIPKVSTAKLVEPLPWAAKPVKRTENEHNNGLTLTRSFSSYPLEFELRKSQRVSVPISSGVSASTPRSYQPQFADERLHNGRNTGEFLGESSPGFDVLVDDMVNSGYLHNQDDMGKESVRGRNMHPATDLNHQHSDFEPYINLERDQINGKDEYNIHNHYGREQWRSYSDKGDDGRLMPERRVRRREESPDEMDGSDLRHRLIKQRVSSSRSAVSPDRHGKPYLRNGHYAMGERYHGHHSHRDQRHFPPENSISTRLQGRLKLPVRSSPDKPVDLRSERERESGRHRVRLSPTKPANHLERYHDRLKQRSHEDLAKDSRNLGSQSTRREDLNPLNFAGPKSLAQLKGTKVSDSSNEQLIKSTDTRLSPEQKSMKFGKTVDFQESEPSYSFGGPKPLSDIPKGKRETAPEIGAIFSNENENSYSDEEEGEVGSFISGAVLDLPYIHAPETVKEDSRSFHIMEESKISATEEGEDGLIHKAREVGHSPANDPVEIEEGVIVDAAEEKVTENSDDRNEESDYEAIEGVDIEAEDDENMYMDDEEEFDDDDEDDFAKKVGVMLS